MLLLFRLFALAFIIGCALATHSSSSWSYSRRHYVPGDYLVRSQSFSPYVSYSKYFQSASPVLYQRPSSFNTYVVRPVSFYPKVYKPNVAYRSSIVAYKPVVYKPFAYRPPVVFKPRFARLADEQQVPQQEQPQQPQEQEPQQPQEQEPQQPQEQEPQQPQEQDPQQPQEQEPQQPQEQEPQQPQQPQQPETPTAEEQQKVFVDRFYSRKSKRSVDAAVQFESGKTSVPKKSSAVFVREQAATKTAPTKTAPKKFVAPFATKTLVRAESKGVPSQPKSIHSLDFF